jgi:hypothetical protein
LPTHWCDSNVPQNGATSWRNIAQTDTEKGEEKAQSSDNAC